MEDQKITAADAARVLEASKKFGEEHNKNGEGRGGDESDLGIIWQQYRLRQSPEEYRAFKQKQLETTAMCDGYDVPL